jgi:hypothetical protein
VVGEAALFQQLREADVGIAEKGRGICDSRALRKKTQWSKIELGLE